MTFETPSRMQVVRKQEKEPRLKEFIGQQLALLSNPDAAAEPVRCLLMARSIDSPVVRALASHAAALAALKIKVRVILSSLDVSADKPDSVTPAWIAGCHGKWTRNAKLVDAHEFLVIGDSATWIGDSMRRDPDKRDAFEAYSSTSTVAGDQASRSFERLWVLCEPISARHRWTPARAVPAELPASTADVAAAAAAMDSVPVPTPGATRH